MNLHWQTETPATKAEITLKEPLIPGRETALTTGQQTWRVRYEPSLDVIFLRCGRNRLQKILSLSGCSVSRGLNEMNCSADLSMTSCPASHIKAQIAVSGPETLYRKKNLQRRGLTIKSPIAGKVLKVCVAPGERVSEGAVVAVIEAMKMENNIHAPAEGIVGQLRIQKDAPVVAGAELLRLEPV